MSNILHYLILSIGINILVFIPAFKLKTDKLTDLTYSFTFIITIGLALAVSEFSTQKILVAIMIAVWSLRLGLFLLNRVRKNQKDRRFDGVRESFPKFLRFWLLQGIAVWIILIPSLFFLLSEGTQVSWIGFLIWIVGLTIESVADFQKFRFNQTSKNKDRFIKEGLWKYSRHPNYFGEILCWIGIYLFVFVSLTDLQKILALISPIFISFLLIKVSGIPLLEKSADKKWGKDPDYQEYKKQTNLIIPG